MAFGDDRPHVVIDTPGEDDEELQELFVSNEDLNFDVSLEDVFLELDYSQPNIAVDTSARYVTHDVVGDVTVRQKLGESPDEISVDGHCTEEEADKIDQLKDYPYIEFISNRWIGFAQVASTNTSPHSEGGTQRGDGSWIHTFTIELVEVTEI